MSVEALAAVLHHSRASATDKVVLLGIANHEGDGGAWPSLATLARYANVNQRSVQYSIRRLQAIGELWIGEHQGGAQHADPRYRTNLYRILVRCPADCDGTTQHRVGDRGDPATQPTAPLTNPGVQPDAPRGAAGRAPGVQPTASEPSLEPSVEPSSSPNGDGVGFEDFWKLYPRKIAPAEARKSWDRQTKGTRTIKATPPEVIIAGLRARVAWWARSRLSMDKIPHPTTWLNQQRWADELEPTPATKAASPARAAADVDAQVRDEFEDAIAAGDATLAWRMFVHKARARGDVWFAEIAGYVAAGTPSHRIPQLVRHDNQQATAADVATVVNAIAEIDARCRAARGEPPLSPPMVKPADRPALKGPA